MAGRRNGRPGRSRSYPLNPRVCPHGDMAAFASRLFPAAIGRFCGARSPARALSRTPKVTGTGALTGQGDRFGGVTVDLADTGLPEDVSESSFGRLLQGWWSQSVNVDGD